MRVLVVDSYYRALVDAVYRANSGLERADYETQKAALMATCFGTSDFYSFNLGLLGHAATEVISTCEPLQRQWAMENGLKSPPVRPAMRGASRLPWKLQFRERAMNAILLDQVRKFRPDVVHFQDPVGTPAKVVENVRKSARLITTQVASHVQKSEALRHFDLVLTSFPHYVDRFRKAGVRSEYFNLGFEPTVLTKLTQTGSPHDIVFVGGLSARHAARTRWLESVAERVSLRWWGYGVEHLAENSPLRAAFQGEAWGLAMYNIFFNSKIVLNNHIDDAEDNANNMRLYEATGTGALLLTDSKKNLPDLFEPGREVGTYVSVDDCVDKIAYYLANEPVRQLVAEAGQRRTLGFHTYRHRMEQFLELVSSELVKA